MQLCQTLLVERGPQSPALLHYTYTSKFTTLIFLPISDYFTFSALQMNTDYQETGQVNLQAQFTMASGDDMDNYQFIWQVIKKPNGR